MKTYISISATKKDLEKLAAALLELEPGKIVRLKTSPEVEFRVIPARRKKGEIETLED